MEQIDLRSRRQEPVARAEEIAKRRAYFIEVGFSPQWIDSSLTKIKSTLYPVFASSS